MSTALPRSESTAADWQSQPWGILICLFVATVLLVALRPAPALRWVETWREAQWREPVRLYIESYMHSPVGETLLVTDRQMQTWVDSSLHQIEGLIPAAQAAPVRRVLAPMVPMAPVLVAPGTSPPPSVDSAPAVVPARPSSVMFVGDSMMQGLGMFLARRLQRELQAKPVDVSKTSTGLANRNYYDWPARFEEFLDIHRPELVIVMLGTNDRLDIVDPADEKKYLRFDSEAWRAAYAARVRQMNDSARAAGATMIWVGLPAMREAQFDEAAQVTAPIIEREAQAAHMLYLASRPVLSDESGQYSHFLREGDRQIQARAGDGVHFAPYGANRLAEALMKTLESRWPPPAQVASR